MGEWENTLRRLIKQNYGSVKAFAEMAGMPPTTVYNILNRGVAGSSTETVNRFYDALKIDWQSLDSFTNPNLDAVKVKARNDGEFSSQEVPVFGRIAAGVPIEMEEGDFGFACPTYLIKRYPKAFYLEVEGESMSRILPNGCYVLVDPDQREPIISGHVYAVCVNGYDATVKRVRKLANGVELIPDSLDPTYHAMIYDTTIADTETITIIGKVVWHTFPYDWEY